MVKLISIFLLILGSTTIAATSLDAERSVVLLRKSKGRCSGVMIAPQVVLTAGHCNLRQGGEAVFYNTETQETPFRRFRAYVIHPDYDLLGHGDLAVALLDGPAPDDYKIFPLATNGQKFERFIRLGFGAYVKEDGQIVSNDSLKAVKVDEVKLDWEWTQRILYFKQPANKTYKGDSGGPTLGLSDGKWYVVGITSRQFDSASDRLQSFFGFYTLPIGGSHYTAASVANYTESISQLLGELRNTEGTNALAKEPLLKTP